MSCSAHMPQAADILLTEPRRDLPAQNGRKCNRRHLFMSSSLAPSISHRSASEPPVLLDSMSVSAWLDTSAASKPRFLFGPSPAFDRTCFKVNHQRQPKRLRKMCTGEGPLLWGLTGYFMLIGPMECLTLQGCDREPRVATPC